MRRQRIFEQRDEQRRRIVHRYIFARTGIVQRQVACGDVDQVFSDWAVKTYTVSFVPFAIVSV